MPSTLSSFPADGWELGIRGYDETMPAPLVRNSALEPVFSDIQTTRLPLCPQTVAGQHNCGNHDCLYYQSQKLCHCFQTVGFLFQEIDSGTVDTSAKDLGSWLSRYREALRCCEALLLCSLHRVKPDHMGFLGLLADRLMIMCDEAISIYMSTWTGNINHNINSHQDGAWLVYIGSFEIDSPLEWRTLISTILAIQLRRLGALMVQFKNLLWYIEAESVREKADLIQSQISALLEKISPPPPDQNRFVVPPSGSLPTLNH
ncbi:hypothetical protein F5B17DRAFT_381267 [Nemania serpens]|nr:hypothetical protein F5B17DRAFT_381267 [Nemania serpens]